MMCDAKNTRIKAGSHCLRQCRSLQLLLALVAPVCLAQQSGSKPEQPLTLGGQVTVGAEYNSNLSVSELESSAGKSDVAGTLDAGVTANWHPNDPFEAEAGYNLTSNRYRDLDNYDLDLHLLYGDVSYDFGAVTLGGNYYIGKAYLGGDDFLMLHQYSLYAGKLIADSWFVRGAYNSVGKNFDTIPARNADNNGFNVDVYRFFNAGKTSVSFGYAYEDEDTIDPSFRYTADTLKLRGSHRFKLLERDARLQGGVRYQSRDYSFITPSINAPRDDSQLVTDVKLEVEMVKNLALIGGWQHGNYQSRLPSAAYTDNRVSMAVQLKF